MRWFLLIAVAVLLWLALQSSQGDGGGDASSLASDGEPADAGSDAANYGNGPSIFSIPGPDGLPLATPQSWALNYQWPAGLEIPLAPGRPNS